MRISRPEKGRLTAGERMNDYGPKETDTAKINTDEMP